MGSIIKTVRVRVEANGSQWEIFTLREDKEGNVLLLVPPPEHHQATASGKKHRARELRYTVHPSRQSDGHLITARLGMVDKSDEIARAFVLCEKSTFLAPLFSMRWGEVRQPAFNPKTRKGDEIAMLPPYDADCNNLVTHCLVSTAPFERAYDEFGFSVELKFSEFHVLIIAQYMLIFPIPDAESASLLNAQLVDADTILQGKHAPHPTYNRSTIADYIAGTAEQFIGRAEERMRGYLAGRTDEIAMRILAHLEAEIAEDEEPAGLLDLASTPYSPGELIAALQRR